MAQSNGNDRSDRPTLIEPLPWVDSPNDAESRAVAKFRDALSQPLAVSNDDLVGSCLGRFRILEKVGSGGMGTVYRARDDRDRIDVAVKVLAPHVTGRPDLLARFQKEARLLAQVVSPYVTRLFEVGEDEGVHYLAAEFVPGDSVATHLQSEKLLSEAAALAVAADAARGLAALHSQGIVHRDVKPGNLLIDRWDGESPDAIHIKLTDLGLARHVVQTESLDLTRSGALIGTPLYMAPEQCAGAGDVDTRSDVYSLGATLFHMLAGRPPFVADDLVQTVEMHRHKTAPRLAGLNARVSEGTCQVVAKALEKRPEMRYADAAEMLTDLQRLLDGDATNIRTHPLIPAANADDVLEFEFVWHLDSSPAELWPHVSNTERLNHAIGLPPVRFSFETDEEGVRRVFGNVRFAGMRMRWREHAFEWIEDKQLGVLREFEGGPLRWVSNVVEMTLRVGSGTTLRHRFRVAAKGFLGRLFAKLQIGVSTRRALDRVYRRIDGVLQNSKGNDLLLDPFRPSGVPTKRQAERLQAIVDRLSQRTGDPSALLRVAEFISSAPAQEVGRIRPRMLARRLELPSAEVIGICLEGTHEGLLVLAWDVICPVCRIAAETHDTLTTLQAHANCEACNQTFQLDFAESVELIFRAHPQVRSADTGTYCIGGPVHSPHVAAQTRVAPGERLELGLNLCEATYQVRGPQLPHNILFDVRPHGQHERFSLDLRQGVAPPAEIELRDRNQVLVVGNHYSSEILLRVERSADNRAAITAAQALSLPSFRDLFPSESLTPEQLSNLSQFTLVATVGTPYETLVAELGEAAARDLLQQFSRSYSRRAREAGAVSVKLFAGQIMTMFLEPLPALRFALQRGIISLDTAVDRVWWVKHGVHRGSVLATTIDGAAEYFGAPVQDVLTLADLAAVEETLISAEIAADTEVARVIAASGLKREEIGDSRYAGGVRLSP